MKNWKKKLLLTTTWRVNSIFTNFMVQTVELYNLNSEKKFNIKL